MIDQRYSLFLVESTRMATKPAQRIRKSKYRFSQSENFRASFQSETDPLQTTKCTFTRSIMATYSCHINIYIIHRAGQPDAEDDVDRVQEDHREHAGREGEHQNISRRDGIRVSVESVLELREFRGTMCPEIELWPERTGDEWNRHRFDPDLLDGFGYGHCAEAWETGPNHSATDQ